MRILLLAPHPFYIVRGTPIDLDLVMRVLSARENTEIDLVVYGTGEDREYPNARLHRAGQASWMRTKRPGFSLQKIFSTGAMFFLAWNLIRRDRPDFIHAGEDAVLLAMFFRLWYGIPYAYDIDSSIAEQMTEQHPVLFFLQPIFNFVQRMAMRMAHVTFPVCNSLADLCRKNGARKIVTLHDISQLESPGREATGSLKREIGKENTKILLYVGNLEKYQGIDLLLEGFAVAARKTEDVDVVVIGGNDRDIAAYQEKARGLGIADRAHLIGPRPFDELEAYLAEADMLTAPRTKGRNTPMKVFPYLHSGRPVIVTDLPTHSQILTPEICVLAPADPEGFGQAIVDLVNDPERQARLAQAGREFIERDHTFEAHKRRLDEAYDWIEERLRVRAEAKAAAAHARS